MAFHVASCIQEDRDEALALRVEVRTSDDVLSPVVRRFVRRVAHAGLLRQRAVAKRNKFELLRDVLFRLHRLLLEFESRCCHDFILAAIPWIVRWP